MTTLKEIASRCGVSATTVSNVLSGKPKVSEETRQKILEEVKRTGYQPNYMAQGLRIQKTHTIGIIAEDICQFSTPDLLDGIMIKLEEAGYRATVKNLRLYSRWGDRWYDMDREYHSVFDPALQELLAAKVDGIIHVAGHGRPIHVYPNDFEKPVVMAYAYSESSQIPSIVLDDEQGSYAMVKHLLSLGHKRIGFISGRADNIHSQLRIAGYQKALYESKILYDPSLVVYGNWDKKTGYEETAHLLQQAPDVSAIFCISDEMSGGVLQYLREQHIEVPGKISVVSFDNRALAEYTFPELTTMAIPLIDIGIRSAEILIDKIEKGSSPEEAPDKVLIERMPCHIVERKSLARYNGK